MTFHLSPEFVRALGWGLLHFVWQGAAVAALLSLLMAFCQKATVRYAASVLALLLMLALPVATFFVLQQPARNAPATITDDASATPVNTAWGPANDRHHSRPSQSEAQPEAIFWLVRLWMIGVACFTLRSAGGFLLVQRVRRIANVPASGELLRLCLAVQHRMGIARAIRFCRSTALQVPAVIGGIRPIVLLPVTALTGLNALQIEAIVAHELAHIRRLDYFVNLFQVFAETALFYHPAVWWVSKTIRTERENCCDDTAISVCGNRLEYVRALTHLASMRLTPQFAMAANGSPLKARVRRLLGMAQEKEGVRSESSVLLGVLIVAGLVLAGNSLSTRAQAQGEKAPVAVTPPVAVEIPAIAPRAAVSAIAPRVAVSVVAPRAPVAIPSHFVVVPTMPMIAPRAAIATAITLRPTISLATPVAMARAIHVQLPSLRALLAQAEAPASPAPPARSESYVEDMKAAGYGDLTVDELVAMKVQGITPDYVRDMKAAGLKMDADELIGMKVQGITPDYVKQMRAAYPNIDSDSIIGMKVQGVTPEYAAELAKLGIKEDADELIGLKVQGVSPEYVRDMRATGIDFDSDELIGMKVQGVTPAYVAALKAAGLGKLDADEIVGAKVMGITPEFIEKARSHGFKDLDLDKLIQLKATGVL